MRMLDRSPSLFPLVVVLIVAAAAATRCGDDDEKGETDSGGQPDIVDELDGTSDTTDDPDSTADTSGDEPVADTEDDSPDLPVCYEDEGERLVGDTCRRDTDRACLDNSHCRETEQCEFEDGDEIGTCIYQLPDPIECPGGPSCPAGSAAPLRAAFATRSITPVGFEEPRPEYVDDKGNFTGDPEVPETFFDCGRDMICPDDDDYVEPDPDGSESDGVMQGIWIAGLSESLPAARCPPELLGDECNGVDCCEDELAHDHIQAIGAIFEQGDSKVALVALDLIGYFYSDLQDLVARLPDTLDIDLVIAASTHAHEGPDTMGLWGPGFYGSDLPVESGVDRTHVAHIHDQIIALLTEADANLAEVDVYATQIHSGVDGVGANDTRDPWIFNDNLALVHVVRAGLDRADAGNTVGVIVNWGNHPESVGFGNRHISSDFPHYVRRYIADGLPEVTRGEDTIAARAGLDGPVMYLSGTLGGLTTPLRTYAVTRDGTEIRENGFAKADAIGQRIAEMALDALATAPAMSSELSFGMREFMAEVPNRRFHIAIFGLELFPWREVYNWRHPPAGVPISPEDPPRLLSAVARMEIGALTFTTVPGEMFPETFVGGFTESDATEAAVRGDDQKLSCTEDLLPPLPETHPEDATFPCLIDPDNPNPPPIESAPDSGFLYDELEGDVHVLIGNGMDSLGYLVPPYDFELHADAPYISEPEGDHYEETNGVGDDTLRAVLDEVEALWGLEELFVRQ